MFAEINEYSALFSWSGSMFKPFLTIHTQESSAYNLLKHEQGVTSFKRNIYDHGAYYLISYVKSPGTICSLCLRQRYDMETPTQTAHNVASYLHLALLPD